MRSFVIIKKIAILLGMIAGMWFGAHQGATNSDVCAAWIIIVLASVLGVSMYEKQPKEDN